ncbi:Flp/Fap pilin component [compost metagenome]
MSLKSLMQKVKRFFKAEDGASGIEYAIIAAMVAVVLAGFVGTTGISGKITTMFTTIQGAL